MLELILLAPLNDKPDYKYLRKMFRGLFMRESFQYDDVFDWTVYKYRKNASMVVDASNKDKDDEHTVLQAQPATLLLPTALPPNLVHARASATGPSTAAPLTTLRTPNVPWKEMTGFFDVRLRSSAKGAALGA